MSRRNQICLILSLIGIAYILFGALSLRNQEQPVQQAVGTESAESEESAETTAGEKKDTSAKNTSQEAAATAESAAKEEKVSKVPPATGDNNEADAVNSKAGKTASDDRKSEKKTEESSAAEKAEESSAAEKAKKTEESSTAEKAKKTEESSTAEKAKKTEESSTAEKVKKAETGSFFRKLSAHEDVSVLVIGDSIGAGVGASDEANKWYNLLETYLERKYESAVTIQNECFGGCTSYGTYVHLKKLIEESSDFDLTIICGGQNDPDEGFSEIYEALLRNINSGFPSSSVICILENTQMEMTEKMVTVQKLAKHYHAGVANTIAAFAKNYDSLSENGFYPNDEGQEMYFRTLINVIDPLVTADTGILIGASDDSDAAEPLDKKVKNFDILKFYPAEQMDRTDAVRYTLDLPYTDSEGDVLENVSGVLGIEMYSPTGEHMVTTAIDGEILGETSIINYTETDETRYHNFGSFTAKKRIRIKFETEEAADRFTGFYVSSAK